METHVVEARRQEITGIQYLRGIAASLVLIIHSDHMLRQEKYFGEPYIGSFSSGGKLGVDLFFVISGVIMFHITNGFSTSTNSWSFVIRRFVRIVPFLWVCIFAHFALRTMVRGPVDPIPFLRAFFIWPVGDFDPNPVWTLRHEFFLYLCSYLCIRFQRGYLVLGAFLLLPIPISLLISKAGFTESELSSNFFNIRANTSFAIGVLIGWIIRKRLTIQDPSVSDFIVLSSAPALLALGFFVAPLVDQYIVKCLLVSTVCGFIVYGSVGCTHLNGSLARLGLLLGNASYSIYLVHELVVSFTGMLFVKLNWTKAVTAAGILSVVLAITFGILIHYLVEKPLVRNLRFRVGA